MVVETVAKSAAVEAPRLHLVKDSNEGGVKVLSAFFLLSTTEKSF